MRSPLDVVLAIMATYRLAHMGALEEGPKDILTELRTSIGQRYGPRSWQFRGINCVLCLSFWLSMPIALLFKPRGVGQFLLDWLGIAGSVITLHKWLHK